MNSKVTSVVIVLLAFLFPPRGFAAGKNDEVAEKLRKVAKLPKVSLQMSFEHGNRNEAAEQEEIKRHQAALTGTDKDAEIYMETGSIYARQKAAERGNEAFQRAIELFRKRLAANAGDVAALAGLSRALVTQQQFEEAERTARQAVKVGPTNADAWAALGFNLAGHALRLLSIRSLPNPEQLIELVIRKASVEAVKQAAELTAEGMKCMDRAVSLDPKQIDLYRERPTIRMLHNLLGVRLGGEPITPAKVTAALWSKESLEDHKKAAELGPESPGSVVAVLQYEMGKIGIYEEFDSQRFIRENEALIGDTMSRLQRMSQSTNRETALDALRLIAILTVFRGDISASLDTFRKIIKLDPAEEVAWDGITGIYVEKNQPEELIKLCEERLKEKESARNRVLLAKAYEFAGKWEKVEPQVRKALELESTNVLAKLSSAVVMLRQSKLEEAQQLLADLRRNSEAEGDFAEQLAYVQGLYWGMKGMRFMAEIELKKVASTEAKQALEIVSRPGKSD
jgi:tetratricopeptide (TPR) repeat protein